MLLFGSHSDSKDKEPRNKTLVDLVERYKQEKTPNDNSLNFEDFNKIRYTFIKQVFEHYGHMNDDFADHLKRLRSDYIWNIYK